jgi:hypothetical protein
MNQIVAKPSFRDVPMVNHGGGGMLMPQTFGEVVSFSEIMARSQHAIPRHLRDVPGACLAVAMQAMRWEMDPFAVASKSYNVKDIIAYEAQLIAAVVHTRAPLKTRPTYEYTGEGQDRRCAVSAMFDDGVTRSYESPRIADITTKNSPLWKADPDQQLGYYSIRAFARRYCPEVILGVYTPEEAEIFRGPDNARDVTPKPSLADRLSAGGDGATQSAGFSQRHVISEIAGDASRTEGGAGHSETPHNATNGKTETVLDHATAGAETGPAGETPATNSASAEQPSDIPPSAPPEAPAAHQPPNPTAAGDNSESSSGPAPSADGEGDGGGDGLDPAGPALPLGWEITYCAALRRAQAKASLEKYAKEFWKQHGGWEAIQGANRETAAAIFNVFRDNFGNKDAIDRDLREII